LDNVYDAETAIEKIKQNTRHYAKRQITWFNKNDRIQWLNGKSKEIASRIAKEFLTIK
jgi:tRNA dimethylallyltransferase